MLPRYSRQRPQPFAAMRVFGRLVVGLFILSLVTRTWLLQGLVVPVTVSGGSMANRWRGPRCEQVCGDCQFRYAWDRLQDPANEWTRCPNCGFAQQQSVDGLEKGGESMLVDRATLTLRRPRRWETVVFRCPEQADQLCVKRIVGLPGESIQIRDGDIHINGQIVRKDLAQQRNLAQIVHDSKHATSSLRHRAPRWVSLPDNRWNGAGSRFNYRFAKTEASDSEQVGWLDFQPLDRVPVTDNYGYNQGTSRHLQHVHDLMVSFELTIDVTEWPVSGSELRLASRDQSDRFVVHLDWSSRQLRLAQNGQTVPAATGSFPVIPRDRSLRVEFSNFDRQLLVAFDGRVAWRHALSESTVRGRPSNRPLAIGIRGMAAQVENLKVWRDVFYLGQSHSFAGWGIDRPLKLGPNEFYLLGDNSPISHDSRSWPRGALPDKLFVGKPLGRFW